MKQSLWIWAALGWAGMLAPGQAQERIYRCGNEYTNSAAAAQRRNCQLVERGHVTVVHSRPVSGQAASTGAGKAAAPRAEGRAAQVDTAQQKARDNDARAILQAELSKAQSKLQTLQAEFNGGQPAKTALELRNPQLYQERLEALQAGIARQEGDIAGIQRELARHAGG